MAKRLDYHITLKFSLYSQTFYMQVMVATIQCPVQWFEVAHSYQYQLVYSLVNESRHCVFPPLVFHSSITSKQ